MTWKKAVLVATVIIAIVAVIVSVRPSNVAELRESANVRLGDSAKIPFKHAFALKGLALSGNWEGSGSAKVWIAGQGRRYLVLDTENIPDVLEFSSFGTRFESVCAESCSFPPLDAEYLFVLLSGPGFLSIDSYHLSVPLDATGFASSKVSRVSQFQSPDHSFLFVALLLALSVVGSHVLGHYCQGNSKKRVVLLIFLFSFLILAGVFGLSMAAPTSNVVLVVKRSASIFSALCLLSLFIITAFETMSHKSSSPQPDVWKELEEVEEKWEKK